MALAHRLCFALMLGLAFCPCSLGLVSAHTITLPPRAWLAPACAPVVLDWHPLLGLACSTCWRGAQLSALARPRMRLLRLSCALLSRWGWCLHHMVCARLMLELASAGAFAHGRRLSMRRSCFALTLGLAYYPRGPLVRRLCFALTPGLVSARAVTLGVCMQFPPRATHMAGAYSGAGCALLSRWR